MSIINNGAIVFDDSIEALMTDFSTKKTIELKLKKEVDHRNLDDLDLVSFNLFSANIEIDVSKNDLTLEISKMLARLPVSDININSISIEEIIKQIYRQ